MPKEVIEGELLTSETKLDDYDVSKQIGKGKFSVVFRAKRKSDGETVALKKIQIYDMMDSKSRKKTLREVQLLKSVAHHNHLIRYLDSFLENNDLYIIFEWAECGDLRTFLRKQKQPLDESTIWSFFSQMADAVRHIHSHRVMHRDIKPANIFMASPHTLKLGDLGLGRLFSDETQEAFSKVGTPLYMSPEVLQGAGYDFQSDVWSLGCLLYEFAALRSPFGGNNENLYAIFKKIHECKYEDLPATYSKELRDLAYSMIQTNPKDRPDIETVAKLADDMCKRQKGNPHATLLVDLIIDKLKLLDYEVEFCREAGVKPLDKLKLVQKYPNTSSQFRYVSLLCHWLLAVSQKSVFLAVEVDTDAKKAASNIISSTLSMGYEGTVSSSNLQHGYGEAVVNVLDFLTARALEANDFSLEDPTYGQEEDVGEEGEEMLGEEEEGLSRESASGTWSMDGAFDDDSGIESDGEDLEGAVLATTRGGRTGATWYMEPSIPGDLWKEETKEIASELSQLTRGYAAILNGEKREQGGMGSLSHVRSLKRQVVWLKSTFDSVHEKLVRVHKDIQDDIAKVEVREKHISESFSVYADQMKQQSETLAGRTSEYDAVAETVQSLSNELQELVDNIHAINDSIEDKQAGAQDSKPLLKIRGALKKLKEEIRMMTLKNGVVMEELSAARLRSHRQPDISHQVAEEGAESDDDE
eukprot:CAMPEP_0113878428 /NCGR_PEP_ID=MMETSP0780_2-20120614/6674_1 /TAXON_ID=652834 /ORGANISM="Palpitomonas bilix" /LENGTH=697 /DNA_ID=CAMNT_0000864891 /DNA_START=227 /DNA_END=2320 /DNA_ORIENTATION=+ /assembly_acc=CAM_ASM_000599